jgi:hypothetical protein
MGNKFVSVYVLYVVHMYVENVKRVMAQVDTDNGLFSKIFCSFFFTSSRNSEMKLIMTEKRLKEKMVVIR